MDNQKGQTVKTVLKNKKTKEPEKNKIDKLDFLKGKYSPSLKVSLKKWIGRSRVRMKYLQCV